jgi:uncharacterized pyridoxamine 5'-phosphate oxidase family protein
MTKDEILKFLNENPAFSLATCEGTIPHVRTLMLHKANETGIYFMVGKFKDVYRQLSLNPSVELCFHTDDFQIRITGQVENLDKELDLKKEILEARPFMKPWIEQVGIKYMAVFKVKNGIAKVWSLESDMQPKDSIK